MAEGRARIFVETLPALGILALAVAAAAIARALKPELPPWAVFGSGAVLACGALLLPRFRRLAAIDLLFENDIFFMAGVVGALVWANVDPHSYHETTGPLDFAVNDVLMAFFFGVAAKEVREAFLPGGPLASLKKAAMPLVATAGGMAGPAAIFFAGAHLLGRPDLARGWAIPTATDIAFSAIVARVIFGASHPAIPFLLLLAIADDAGGLAILAVFYPTAPLSAGWLLGLVGGGVLAGLALRRFGVQSPWPYVVVGGGLAWLGMHWGGIHPALALVPIIPTLPVPTTEKDSGIFDTAAVHEEPQSALNHFEEALSAPVSLILGLFGLVNAGVPLRGFGTATWLVLGGLALGKPIGISLAVALGKVGGLAIPDGMRARDVVVLGIAAGIGFTVALFVATVAFKSLPGEDLDAAKMGALGSVLASVVAIIIGKAVGIERRP
jgi:NhaA family Na+:H+ antiporter